MGALASLSRPDLAVIPGNEVAVTVTVRNSGSVVDEFRVEPLGDAAAWARVEPATVPLYPGASADVVVTFAPPASSAVGIGDLPFGLRVLSREDPAGSVVEEGVLSVGRFADTAAELLPRTSRARGRRRGRHELAVDNRGNAPLDVRVTPTDPNEKLEIAALAGGLGVGPGQAGFLRVEVRGRRRFFRGPAVTHPFQLLLEPNDDAPLVVEGTFLQEAVFPRWLGRLIAALIALAAILTALWFAVLRPTVRDAAKEQAKETAQATGAMAGAAAGKQAAEQAGGGGSQPSPPPPPSTSPTVAPSTLPSTPPTAVPPSRPNVPPAPAPLGGALGSPYFTRLAASATQQAPAAVFSPQQILSLTDIVLANPAGDSGSLTLTCGTQVLIGTNLANFRDLDYHFVSPLQCGPGQALTSTIACQNPGGTPCTPAVSIAGYVRQPPAPPKQ